MADDKAFERHGSTEIRRLWREFGWLQPTGTRASSIDDSERDISYPGMGHELLVDFAHESFWSVHRRQLILDSMRRHSCRAIWEVGAGTGDVAAFLQQNGVCTVALEPVGAGAKVLDERGITTFQSTLEEMHLPSESLPSVGVFDVIEHLEHPMQLLKEVHRVLKPNGKLFLTVPAHQALWSVEDETSGHFRRYNRRTIKNLLQSEGFQIESVSHFFSYLVPPAFFVRRMLPRIRRTRERDLNHEVAIQLKPPRTVTAVLRLLGRLEARTLKLFTLPLGLSILVVASKVGEKSEARVDYSADC